MTIQPMGAETVGTSPETVTPMTVIQTKTRSFTLWLAVAGAAPKARFTH
jgi:hypothetical protein